MVRLLVAALVVGLTAARGAWAEGESTKLFEEGRALAKDGKYEEACAKFAKSLELDRAPGTLLNYGDCHEHLGHLAQAWRLYDEAARASEQEKNADRAKYARERAQALVPKTSTLVVKLATPGVPGLTVAIAGRSATPAAEIREVVDPGDVVIDVAAPDMQPFTKTEHAEAGLRIIVEVPALVPAPKQPVDVVTATRRRTRVVAAYTLVGVGGASMGVGITLGLLAKARYDREFDVNCSDTSPPMCNEDGARNQRSAIAEANVGTGFAVAGLVLIGAGAAVYLTAPKDVVVIPTATASSGGLAVVGRF